MTKQYRIDLMIECITQSVSVISLNSADAAPHPTVAEAGERGHCSRAVQGVIIVLAVAFSVCHNRKSAELTGTRRKKASLTAGKEA